MHYTSNLELKEQAESIVRAVTEKDIEHLVMRLKSKIDEASYAKRSVVPNDVKEVDEVIKFIVQSPNNQVYLNACLIIEKCQEIIDGLNNRTRIEGKAEYLVNCLNNMQQSADTIAINSALYHSEEAQKCMILNSVVCTAKRAMDWEILPAAYI